MIWPVKIASFQEYKLFENFRYNPLIYEPFFDIAPEVRTEIITLIFGKQSPRNDALFYRWMWDHKPHTCEEYQCPLQEYSARHISHIITRGSHTEMRYDPRNINILSVKAHREWETGTEKQRRKMNIWPQNQIIIQKLKDEYRRI